MTTHTPKRRWFQFRLRAMLVAMTIIACGCGWFAYRLQKAQRQHIARMQLATQAEFEFYTLESVYETDAWTLASELHEPTTLKKLLGKDFFPVEDVLTVFQLTDPNADLSALGELNCVRGLVFTSSSNVSDAHLAPVQQLTQLQYFSLESPLVTSQGLSHLANLRHLEFLEFCATAAKPDGMVFLRNLTELKILDLSHTNVGSRGLENIAGMKLLRILKLNDADIGDDGLVYLPGHDCLRDLELCSNQITDAGLTAFRGLNLTSLDLSDNSLTDAGLPHLQCLGQLEYRALKNTKVTESGIEALQAALPQCRICH